MERARKGYEELFVYVRGLMAGSRASPDGVFTGFVRILLRYPEILAWEYRSRCRREEVMQAMYAAAKAVKPSAQIGWHVDHQPSSWDIVYRAELSYEEMAPYSDFIKFIAYHDVLGPRIRWWYLDRLQKTVLAELPLEDSLTCTTICSGTTGRANRSMDRLEPDGMSPDYVARETPPQRCLRRRQDEDLHRRGLRRPVGQPLAARRSAAGLRRGRQILRRRRGRDRHLT